jgi:hypothetical protein
LGGSWLHIIFRRIRRLELFCSGHNNDRAPARQTTRTFFFGRNNDRASARHTTVSFFPVVIMNVHPTLVSGFGAIFSPIASNQDKPGGTNFFWLPSPHRINLEEPVRVASPTRINSPGGTCQGGQPNQDKFFPLSVIPSVSKGQESRVKECKPY